MEIKNKHHSLNVGTLISPISIGDSEIEVGYKFGLVKSNFVLSFGAGLSLSPFQGGPVKSEGNSKAGISEWSAQKDSQISFSGQISGMWHPIKGRFGIVGFGLQGDVGYFYRSGDTVAMKPDNATENANYGTAVEPTIFDPMSNGLVIQGLLFQGSIIAEYLIPKSFLALYLKGTIQGYLPLSSSVEAVSWGNLSIALGIIFYINSSSTKPAKDIAVKKPEIPIVTPPAPRVVISIVTPLVKPATKIEPLPPRVPTQNHLNIFKKAYRDEIKTAYRANMASKEALQKAKWKLIVEAKKFLRLAYLARKERLSLKKKETNSFDQLTQKEKLLLNKLVKGAKSLRQMAKSNLKAVEEKLLLDRATRNVRINSKEVLDFANKALKKATDSKVKDDPRMKMIAGRSKKIIKELRSIKKRADEAVKNKSLRKVKIFIRQIVKLKTKTRKLFKSADAIYRSIGY
ncbi:MAG: hypothetical protein ABIE74_09140 [Pseudomonadota bacterium]